MNLKFESEVHFRMSRGISFHTVGAATENARLAKTVLHGGTFNRHLASDRSPLSGL